MLFQSLSNDLPGYTASHSRRPVGKKQIIMNIIIFIITNIVITTIDPELFGQ
jgi:hypothetical protein